VAVVNDKGADFSLEEVELEGPREDEVLVRIVATGICHTDIHLKYSLSDGMFPRVFGHEGSGVVAALGLGAEEYAIDAIDLLQTGKVIRSTIEGDADPQEMVPCLIALNAGRRVRCRRPDRDVPVQRDQHSCRRCPRREGRETGLGLVTAQRQTRQRTFGRKTFRAPSGAC
jgi:Zn-dependent alcohol dehydrogenase